MKTMKKILAVFGLLALSASADARYGSWNEGSLMFSGEGQFSHDNSVTASLYSTSSRNLGRSTLADGAVIVIEAAGVIGTVDNDGATMWISPSIGATDMISATLICDDGRFYVRAVGVVRSTGSSGTILWSVQVWHDANVAANTNAAAMYSQATSSTANTVDWTFSGRTGQEVGLNFDWAAADSANTLDVEIFNVWVK